MATSAQALPTATLLLVEDDPGDVMMITEVLESMAYPRVIHVARDGQQALDFLRHSDGFADAPRPDLILMDLNMPRMDGREALATIKGDEDLRTIPVVVFTTSSSQEDIESSYGHHANAYVTKPVELDDLLQALHKIDEFFTHVAARSPR